MKKLNHIFAGVLYLLLTIGVSVNSHYCGGMLLETYVYATPECPFCDFEDRDDNDCCDDESEFIAVDDNQQILSKTTLDDRVNVLLYEVFETTIDLSEIEQSPVVFDDSSPPDPDRDLITLYSTYTFYG